MTLGPLTWPVGQRYACRSLDRAQPARVSKPYCSASPTVVLPADCPDCPDCHLAGDDLSPASLAALPFVRQLDPDKPPCMWSMPGIADYRQGVELGLDFARRFGRFLVAHPEYAGSGVLGDIVRDMNHHDASAARGCTLGFFSGIEQLIFETPTCRR